MQEDQDTIFLLETERGCSRFHGCTIVGKRWDPHRLSLTSQLIQHLRWVPGTHSQGTGVSGGEWWTKRKLRAFLLIGPPRRKSVQNWHGLFQTRAFTSYKCAGLPRSGKGRRKEDEYFNTICRLLLFSPTKNLPNLEEWKRRRVEEGAVLLTGFLPGRRESHHRSCENESCLFYQDFAQIFWETCHWGYNRDDCPFW